MNSRRIFCNNMLPQLMKTNSDSFKTDLSKSKQVTVELRCIFVKICQVDTVNEHYYADIYIQGKWREPQLDNKPDLKNINLSNYWNPKLYIDNVFGENKENVSLDVFYPEKSQNAFIIEKRRVKGVFHETLELKQFPFDCQDLSVSVSSECSCDEIHLIESENEISKLNVFDAADSQEWNLHNHVEVTSRIVATECDIGATKRQIISFTCRASRRFGYFLVNHVLISALLCLLAFCSYAVSPQNTHGRLQLCMIILLTTVTFKVVVSQNLPKISYLTYLDKAVLGNIFVIMCLCIWHAALSIFFSDMAQSTSTDLPNNVSDATTITKIRVVERIVIPALVGLYLLTMMIFGLVIYFDAGSRRREMLAKDHQFASRLQVLPESDCTSVPA